MIINQIQSKIQASTLSASILHREEIVNLLAEAIGISQMNQMVPHKLILFCKPAGYGKISTYKIRLMKAIPGMASILF